MFNINLKTNNDSLAISQNIMAMTEADSLVTTKESSLAKHCRCLTALIPGYFEAWDNSFQ